VQHYTLTLEASDTTDAHKEISLQNLKTANTFAFCAPYNL